MIRKILLFTVLICGALPAHANIDTYCFSSEKLTEMHDQLSSQSLDMQNAYNELFEILLAKNESGASDNAGCITQSELAQICKNVWDDNTEICETFIYAIMTEPRSDNFSPLEFSQKLKFTESDFATIDPDAFSDAVNKCVARRRDRSIPSKLQDMGPVFLEQAREKQINPFISAAISLYESGRGTSSLARNKNNIAGLGGPGKWMTFETVRDSIETQARTLYNKVESGKTDLNKLACSGSYCATNTGPWYRDVSSVAKELYRNYNAILQNKNK